MDESASEQPLLPLLFLCGNFRSFLFFSGIATRAIPDKDLEFLFPPFSPPPFPPIDFPFFFFPNVPPSQQRQISAQR